MSLGFWHTPMGTDHSHRTATLAAEEALLLSGRLSVNWIISRRTDLCCFIGGALAGYAMFFLHAGLGLNMITVWFIWYMVLDAPHFFGTYSRTYLDREEMRTRRRLLLGSLLLLLVGPAIVLLSYGLHAGGIASHRMPFLVLVGFVSLWAYWHVVRQHYGIMALYKRKNGDVQPWDRRLDQMILYTGLLAPFLAFGLRHPDARVTLGLSAVPAVGGWEHLLINGTLGLLAGIIVVFAGRQVHRWRTGRPLNVPKLLFLLAVVPLHCFICYHPAVLTAPLLGFSAFVTIYHDIQYHAIVYYYQRNRCHSEGVDGARFGLATKVSRNLPVFMGCAIAMGVTLGVIGCLLEVSPGCIPFLPSGTVALFGDVKLQDLFYSVFLGVLMHHYFVDQFIWRPSRDRNVQKGLKLSADSPAH